MNNSQAIKKFVQEVQKLAPGDVRFLTLALSDAQRPLDDLDNGDETTWTVVIGNGSGTFTVAEAKAADEKVVRRVAGDILGISMETRAEKLRATMEHNLEETRRNKAALEEKRKAALDELNRKIADLNAEAEQRTLLLDANEKYFTDQIAALDAFPVEAE